MQIDFINPVISSCRKVLGTTGNLTLKAGKPMVRDRYEVIPGRNITGLISMKGKNYRASFAIVFTEPVLKKLAVRMLNHKGDKLDSVALDLAGELSNMILGGAKSAWERGGYQLHLSLPTVIMGSDYLIAHQTKSAIFQQSFETSAGDILIEASFEGQPPVKPNLEELRKANDITLF